MTDDTTETNEQDSTPSAPHVFALRHAAGVPYRLTSRGLPGFGLGDYDKRYRLIEDEDVAADLREYNNDRNPSVFRHLSAEDVEAALGTAADAVDAIAAGEHDDVLDLLLFAERRAFSSRVTVIDAIGDRHRERIEQLHASEDVDGDILTPEDVTPINDPDVAAVSGDP
jgi:hypothetical protein